MTDALWTHPALQQAGSRALPWLWTLAALFAAASLVIGLGMVPSDPAEGEMHRVALLQRPALWVSGVLCALMTLLGVVGLITGDAVPLLLAGATVPSAALMSFIALWTGAMHDRPVSGAWWTGEAAAVVEALLLLLCLALMGLKVALGDPARADRALARGAIAGSAALLLVWLALQAGGGAATQAPRADGAQDGIVMPIAVAMMAGAFTAHGMAACLSRARSLLLERGERPFAPSRRPGA